MAHGGRRQSLFFRLGLHATARRERTAPSSGDVDDWAGRGRWGRGPIMDQRGSPLLRPASLASLGRTP